MIKEREEIWQAKVKKNRRIRVKDRHIRSAINKSGRVYPPAGVPAGGWHRRCRRRRRHRACLDGANKIRPNFTVQTAKQWY